MHVVGIGRATIYSPGRHAVNDRLILESTGDALRRRGCTVELIHEEQVAAIPGKVGAIFSMCQGPEATKQLLALERRGPVIINSPRAVQGCYRARLFGGSKVDRSLFARTHLVATALPDVGAIAIPAHARLWVKRGDVHSMQPEDVQAVDGRVALARVLDEFSGRGIASAIVQEHVPGTVVKFYGVLGSPFFRYYPEKPGTRPPVDLAASRRYIERAIRQVGLEVYGGDCVISEDGRVTIIDINDWPSYASFCEEAADAIAARLWDRFRDRARLPKAEDAWLADW